ncbi:sensor histidine kinase [Pedobacter sp. ASV12]|uniref:sensor histidine kinase n=1 Tax=Pedobacter sp. ASV12 TaxID=2795120 RepID=UPI0018EA59B3|nr:histidine kinase [Pedobacter sp. ASV12]
MDTSNTQQKKGKTPRKWGNRLLFYFTVMAVVPVYWASLFYIKLVSGNNAEELGFAVTVAFFLFLYLGWYLADSWQLKSERLLKKAITALGLVVVACFVGLFIHADIQLPHLPAVNLLLFWALFILLSSALGAWLKFLVKRFNLRIDQANALATQSKSELQLLQSQLSPHFLFNTLNNMYGLSISDHEKIPDLLLKLSELLRYSVYEAKELLVPLKSELAYIHNYIDFEKIRIGNRLSLTCNLEQVGTEHIKIAPMLLIVFIENAFKHSKNTAQKSIVIDITLKTWEDWILFSIRNSFDEHEEKTKNLSSGLGLSNTYQRLKVLYPNQYELKISKDEGMYNVSLQLKMK